MNKWLPLVVFSAMALPAAAQVSVTVGPAVAPPGCDFLITVSNDTAQTLLIGDGCPFSVRDLSTNQVVFSGPCPIFVPFTVGPGGVQTVLPWSQTNMLGMPVPPGAYQIDVNILGVAPPSSHIVVIDPNVDAAIASLGVHRIGTSRQLSFCAPADASLSYLAAASFTTTPGIPTCGGVVPLAQDALFFLSLGPNPFFQGFSGVLNTAGRSTDATISVPNDPALNGAAFVVAFVTVDPLLTCPLASLSAAHTIVIP